MTKSMALILEETITAYTIDTRAMQTNEDGSVNCCYLAEDGRMCAVGRCLLDPGAHPSTTSAHGLDTLRGLDNLLLPLYRGHASMFWSRLQSLHDGEHYWDDEGLSPDGKQRAREIAREFQIPLHEVPTLSNKP